MTSALAATTFVLGLASFVSAASAQGTAEQREACAPDAIKLCSDTIPDEGRTKACMEKHLQELSPRCRTVFLEATRPGGGQPGEAPGAETPDTGVAAAAPTVPEDPIAGYRAEIAKDCREGLIDPFTCRNTMDVLRGE